MKKLLSVYLIGLILVLMIVLKMHAQDQYMENVTIEHWEKNKKTAVLHANKLIIHSEEKYTITAYCSGEITFTGEKVREGLCAVDPKVISLHSKIEIEGLGIFQAEDTGGKVKGKHIDIYIKDCNKATEFGVKKLSVKVLP